VNFGTRRAATAVTIFAPSLGDAAALVLAPDHEAGDVLQEHERNAALAAQLDEVRALQRRLARTGCRCWRRCRPACPSMRAKPRDQRGAVARLELVELAMPSTMRAMTSRTS
jgi:hypothetical protein